jgi:hypothetical protein
MSGVCAFLFWVILPTLATVAVVLAYRVQRQRRAIEGLSTALAGAAAQFEADAELHRLHGDGYKAIVKADHARFARHVLSLWGHRR